MYNGLQVTKEAGSISRIIQDLLTLDEAYLLCKNLEEETGKDWFYIGDMKQFYSNHKINNNKEGGCKICDKLSQIHD